MRPYKIKSAEKIINGEPLPGYALYRNGEKAFFVYAFEIREYQDKVNHINEAFYIYDQYMREKNEAR
jgi:hypothetical protein